MHAYACVHMHGSKCLCVSSLILNRSRSSLKQTGYHQVKLFREINHTQTQSALKQAD